MVEVYKDFNVTDYRFPFKLIVIQKTKIKNNFDDDAMWENAQTMLKAAMDESEFGLFPEAEGKQRSMVQN